MRQQLSILQKIKTAIHAVVALSIFLAACIQMAVFTGTGSTDGRSKFYFAVCWLSIPALVYLVAVPLWSRAANVAKAMWFAIVDVLVTLLWLSAFAAVLAWNNAGIKQGAKDQKKEGDADCNTFAYGSEKQCKLSYAVSGFGLWIFILFLGTSAISIFYTIKARKNPKADDPWLASSAQNSSYAPARNDTERNPSATKDPVWDPSMNNNDDESVDERGPYPHQRYHGARHEYGHKTHDGRHPARPVHWDPLEEPQDHSGAPPYGDTEYRGASTYQAPSAMNPTSVYSPPGHDTYDAYGSGRGRHGAYSFSGS